MVFFGITQFLLTCIILIYEFKRKSSAVFMWATIFLMFALMHLLTSVVGDQEYSDTVILKASYFAVGFELLYLLMRITLTRLFFKRNFIQQTSSTKRKDDSLVIANIFFATFIFVVIVKMVILFIQLGSLRNASWGALRKLSSNRKYVNIMQPLSILYFLSSGVGLYYLRERKKLHVITIAALLLLNTLVTRNRIEILPLFIVIISLFVFNTKKITWKTLVLAFISCIIVLYIVYALRVFRHYGTTKMFIENATFLDFNKRIFTHLYTGNGELGLRRHFYYFINGNNNFENFGQGHTYLRMLLVFIPTKWSFGIKPPDFAISMGYATGMPIGGSIHPTLLGDCYANLGWWGIALGAFWALYTTIGDRLVLISNKKVVRDIIYTLLGTTYVIIGRGSVYNGFVILAYGLLIYFICRKIFPNIINIICKQYNNRKIK